MGSYLWQKRSCRTLNAAHEAEGKGIEELAADYARSKTCKPDGLFSKKQIPATFQDIYEDIKEAWLAGRSSISGGEKEKVTKNFLEKDPIERHLLRIKQIQADFAKEDEVIHTEISQSFINKLKAIKEQDEHERSNALSIEEMGSRYFDGRVNLINELISFLDGKGLDVVIINSNKNI
jgi:hypothetical protein